MSDGLKLLTSILETGGVQAMRGLDAAWFAGDADEIELHDFVAAHVRRYGRLPQIETVETELGRRLPATPENVEFYRDAVVDRHYFRRLLTNFGEMRTALADKDMARARQAALAMAADSHGSGGSEEDLRDYGAAAESMLAQYHVAIENPGMNGIPSGWEDFDASTGGYQNADLVAFVARMGMGKSYVILKQAQHAWRQGYNVLFVTMEMSIEQCARRIGGIESQINPDFIRKGTLNARTRQRLERYVDSLRERSAQTERLMFYAGGFSKNVGDVEILMNEIQPDVVFVDGAYILSPIEKNPRNHRFDNVALVYGDLKRMTIAMNRPIITTTQFNRQAGKKGKEGSLETIGYSDEIAKHASLVYGIREGNAPHTDSRRIISTMKGREGESGDFEINFSFSPMDFSQVPRENQRAEEQVEVDWMT